MPGEQKMTDQELIATWMAGMPKPTDQPEEALDADLTGAPLNTGGGWWECHCFWDDGDVPKWYPRAMTLDALHLVEAKLSDEQWESYCATFAVNNIGRDIADEQTYRNQVIWDRLHLHATAEQKIKALASVLRPVVEGKAALEQGQAPEEK